MKKRIYFFCLLLPVVLTILFLLPQMLVDAEGSIPQGEVINSQATFFLGDEPMPKILLDGKEQTYLTLPSTELNISSEWEIGGLYIKFDRDPAPWTVRYLEEEQQCGQYAFLHEYQKIEADGVKELNISFAPNTAIADIYLLSKGKVPDFVQVWRPAEGVADLLIAVAHSDDDQLFFAGTIPDAVARGAEVQVCYFTNHLNTHTRPHELLNGLYTCGLDRYPVVGELPDIKRSASAEEALEIWKPYGFDYDGIVGMQVELLRKYKPQIVLGHDVNGEYGHGAHMLDAKTLKDAVLAASKKDRYLESAEKYGVWDVPKTYLHLWKENKIDFELDKPLDYFGGKTAYQVSQEAFKCHISQFSSRYKVWLLGTEEEPVTKASEFGKAVNKSGMYSPREFGLWRTTVGKDMVKSDIYEHITFYAEQNCIEPKQSVRLFAVLSCVTVLCVIVLIGAGVCIAVVVRKKRRV